MDEDTCRGDGRTLLMVAHNTRTPAGAQTIAVRASGLATRVGPFPTTLADVLGPSPSEVLATTAEPVIALPAFLASGLHRHTDLPTPRPERASPHTCLPQVPAGWLPSHHIDWPPASFTHGWPPPETTSWLHPWA